MPSPDHPIELKNLYLQHPQLGAKSRHTGSCDLGQPLVMCISDHAKNPLDAIATDRRYDPKLRKMRPDRIDYRGLLAHQQMTAAVKRQAALLLGGLCRHKTHIGSADRLTDCLSVDGIVLMPLHIGLNVSWRYELCG